ncbi:hypothetical protein [[Clostridium] polysaccharolyticum]|uniref:ABC-2 family transporter protein n=1 Tax=[Clostridium] polysaccharolyticum TaxID=29364 RepID=A0A1H9ZAQ6_9FIRM|nr:hypothetical protein [[Clostridium] polysaccharolyticum]SES78637.1 hypothetical protein SAMN04487772_103101 [[Clostridium] polysaccharolyticum]
MLGKLMKYDFKAIFKYFIPLSIFIFVYSCFGTLLFNVKTGFVAKGTLINTLIVLLLITYVISIIGYNLMIQGIIVVNFYKSMVTDTGYLTHTLPVKKSDLLLSKLLTGVITLICSYVVLIVCATIMLDIPTNLIEYRHDIAAALHLSSKLINLSAIIKLIVNLIFTAIVGSIFSLCLYFVSIALGQLINRHKIVGSLLSFFGLSILLQIFSSIASVFFNEFAYMSDSTVIKFITPINTVFCLILLLLSALFMFITHFIFTRKLNLD